MYNWMNKIIATIMMVALFTTGYTTIEVEATSPMKPSNVNFEIDGYEVDFNYYGLYPYMENGTTMVPLKVISEELYLLYDDETFVDTGMILIIEDNFDEAYATFVYPEGQIVSFARAELLDYDEDVKNELYTIEMDIEVLIDDTPQIVVRNGEIYVPAKFLTETWGYKVTWDSKKNTVKLNTENRTMPKNENSMHFNVLMDYSEKYENGISSMLLNGKIKEFNYDLLYEFRLKMYLDEYNLDEIGLEFLLTEEGDDLAELNAVFTMNDDGSVNINAEFIEEGWIKHNFNFDYFIEYLN